MTDATSAGAVATPSPKLDELMMAMDVVDTLRHQENLALKELGQDDRDDGLKARLRQIYEDQGLAVNDRILEAGIKALKEQRFSYTPEGSGFGRFMAGLWVKRGLVGTALAALVVAGGVAIGVTAWNETQALRAADQARVELETTLPQQLSQAYAQAKAEARVGTAGQAADRLIADGQAALARKDAVGARKAITDLDALRAALVQTYVLRIVSREGEQTGVFRIPDVNTQARNYYLIVEPVTPSGQVLALPILNEETNRTETVSKFGQRVSREVFDAVRRDKQDDGIIQRNALGEKPRGTLDIVYSMPVLNGRITKW
jgi:hypothetical protein